MPCRSSCGRSLAARPPGGGQGGAPAERNTIAANAGVRNRSETRASGKGAHDLRLASQGGLGRPDAGASLSALPVRFLNIGREAERELLGIQRLNVDLRFVAYLYFSAAGYRGFRLIAHQRERIARGRPIALFGGAPSMGWPSRPRNHHSGTKPRGTTDPPATPSGNTLPEGSSRGEDQ
jgi:hypothetical protein